ncbi:heme biosynthesis protein HemY [Minwuia thermotolerans]|uniref:HemY N-terminal domain-containing protein n=1 Tax=Minwuia thermotolerans TaxID=2056226 RepID=A0A2M9G6Q2_9PROT|nr:heme biosynthesis HemY N-terminal domain-containing protein [Minwuia thermotolerans]PJK31346.1 hypothetical protein CVT23_01300 [Minwuia thermotolerans]
MIRLIILFLVVVALAAVAAWLADNPGRVSMQWGGWQIDTSVPVIVGALAILIGVILLIYRLIGWLLAGPERIRGFFRGNRSEKGYRALTEGMAAIASGDWRRATKAAEQADRYLANPPMALLLKAQAAQLAGDDRQAESHFRAMLETPETELVALRGLLIQAGRAGDHDRALELAARAHRLRPDAGWAVRALFDLQSAARDWRGAQVTLADGVRTAVYEKEAARRLHAVIDTALAMEKEEAGDLKSALSYAQNALKEDPNHVPAVVVEGRLQAAAGRERRATRHLGEGWSRLQHPDIARAIMDLHPDEDAEARLKRFEKITAADVDHAETQLTLGRLALDADRVDLARDYAYAALDRAPVVDQRFCRLMVDVAERSEGGAEKAREWLGRLADAPPPGRWQCSACNAIAPGWKPLCPSCGHFDGLEWRAAEPLRDAVLLVEREHEPTKVEAQIEEAVTEEDAPPTRNRGSGG